MTEIGLYVHIPFCKQKCYYCDFCSYANKTNLQERYIDAVIKELKEVSKKEEFKVNTIYIGGGTPSILNANLIKKLMENINSFFFVSDTAEITIEINPGTLNREKTEVYKACGINRASIGLQTSNDNLLKSIGRIHTFSEFEEAYNLIKEAGISNINVDLMIGLPNQTMDDVNKTIESIGKKNPNHISVYSLIVELNTKMEELINSKKVKLPNEELEREMYWNVNAKLKQFGYNHYEISNYAKPGFESRHNTDCWNQKEYIGVGAAAHSYYNKCRYSNIENVEEYINNLQSNNYKKNIVVHENQSNLDTMKEYMILGLRKIDGIDIESFIKKFGKSPIELFKKELNKSVNNGFLLVDNKCIKLTPKGIDFANIVWAEFV